MSWLAKLYQIYEAVEDLDLSESEQIMPICHTPQNAHICITINGAGDFISAKVLPKKTQIILPATEESSNRTSGKAPHSLADKIQYVAKDYQDFGGVKKTYFNSYQKQLQTWVNSEFSHPKAKAVYQYISKGTVIADLVKAGVCQLDENQQLRTSWENKDIKKPDLFEVLPNKKGEYEQGDAMVCWRVEIEGDNCPETYKDKKLRDAWIKFDLSNNDHKALCLVTGKEQAVAVNHPAKLRHNGDKAKLISSNDTSGFTFRGRFYDSEQAATVSFDVTQKAHNALRWLIKRQGHRSDDQVIVAWAVSGKDIPQPFAKLEENDLFADLGDQNVEPVYKKASQPDHTQDVGNRFANVFKQKLQGFYSGRTQDITDSIVVMVLDSATPGRMGIVYYRDFKPDQYFLNLAAWHDDCAWWQRASKKKREAGMPKWYLCAPSVWSILQATYGDIIKSNKTLEKNLYERLLPCVTEKCPIPLDIMRRVVSRATQRHSFKMDEQWQWEQNLGVACALYRGYVIRKLRRKYAMALEKENTSRDYLYGRLLAVAENIEQFSLDKSGEKRLTNAGRLMQRFADRPFSTWKTIELSIQPYWQRLQTASGGFVNVRKKLLDEVMGLFDAESFSSDKALSAEFLLGFHSQRLELMAKKTESKTQPQLETENA